MIHNDNPPQKPAEYDELVDAVRTLHGEFSSWSLQHVVNADRRKALLDLNDRVLELAAHPGINRYVEYRRDRDAEPVTLRETISVLQDTTEDSVRWLGEVPIAASYGVPAHYLKKLRSESLKTLPRLSETRHPLANPGEGELPVPPIVERIARQLRIPEALELSTGRVKRGRRGVQRPGRKPTTGLRRGEARRPLNKNNIALLVGLLLLLTNTAEAPLIVYELSFSFAASSCLRANSGRG